MPAPSTPTEVTFDDGVDEELLFDTDSIIDELEELLPYLARILQKLPAVRSGWDAALAARFGDADFDLDAGSPTWSRLSALLGVLVVAGRVAGGRETLVDEQAIEAAMAQVWASQPGIDTYRVDADSRAGRMAELMAQIGVTVRRAESLDAATT